MKKSVVKIAEMKPSDVSVIKQIEIECSLTDWKIDDYLNEISKNDSITKVAIFKDKITGFILARLITNKDLHQSTTNCAEIYHIAVIEKYRKKGIGNMLISDLVKTCRKNDISEIFLEVRQSNKTAHRFYLKNKFEEIAERKNYFTAPTENAVIMKCVLQKKNERKERLIT